MMTSIRISRVGWAIALGLVLGLTGCGGSSSSGSGTPAAQAKKKTHAHQSNDPSERAPADMVAAVSGAKAGPPVELKFELREAPEANQVVDVDIAVLPDVPAINRISGKFQAGEGLELVEGGDLPAVDKPAPGTVIRHVVQIIPKEDGIYTVNAIISVDLADGSITRSYSIPVIVGEGLSDEGAKSEVAEEMPHGSSGQAAAPGTGSKSR
jgi:hypothetical protein